MPFVGIGVGIGRQRFASGIFAAYAARVAADGGVTEAGACVNAVSGISLNSSLLLVPSGYKSGVVYSEIPTNGDGDLTFTRASDATRVNSDGEIEVVGSGVPRLDYSQGSCPALLLEPQRTNSFTQSESFADYYTNRATATDLGTPSIFSSGSIARFTANNAAAYFGKIISSITSGSTYTVSGFFDLSEGIYAGITDGSNFRIFNLLTASVVGSGGGTLTISCKSTQVGSSNYYRVAFTFTATTTGTHFFVIGKNDGGVNTTNETVAAGYFQREDSASYATSYIKTTSATVTRLADSFSRNNIYTNGLITSSGGTWYIELKNNVAYLRDANNGIFLGDSTTINSGNQFTIRNYSAIGVVRLGIFKYISSVPTPLFFTSTDTVKIAIKWDGTGADVFVNGVKEVSATAFTTTLMEFLLANGNDVPKFIQSMALFNTPLSDSNCVTLTT